jgi:dienelactone hydrolase
VPVVNRPVLDVDTPSGDVRAIALVLHGGRANGTGAVRPTQLAVVRMTPFSNSLQRAGRGRGLAVARLRYAVRGWNRAQQSPVPDVRWALDQLAERFPGVPVALVGHSMGARAALYAADHDSVDVVVGLAPWIEAEDPYEQLAGRQLLIVHGDRDRITNARGSASYADRARTVAASASYVGIHGERHAMLRRAKLWHALATGYVLAVMFGAAPEETVDGSTAKVLGKVLAGEASLVV